MVVISCLGQGKKGPIQQAMGQALGGEEGPYVGIIVRVFRNQVWVGQKGQREVCVEVL